MNLNLNLNHLEYFIKIVEKNSFTEVAKEVYITQPALSKAMANLENELGIKLFDKIGRGIKITAEGRVFYTHIKSGLEEIKKAKYEIEKMKKINEKRLKIAITPNIGIKFISDPIGEFLNKNNDTKIELMQLEYEKMVEKVDNNELDICFFETENKNVRCEKVEVELVKKEEFVLIVSKKHKLAKKEKISIKELQEEAFILGCKNIDIKKFGYIPKVSVKPDNFSEYEELVAAGAGVALVPKTSYIDEKKIKIIEIEELLKERYIYIAWKKGENRKIIEELKKDMKRSYINR